jgi:prevent-host-death family protein
MRVAVTNARAQLTELIRRAEAGEEVVLTRHGHGVVRLVAIKRVIDRQAHVGMRTYPETERIRCYKYAVDEFPVEKTVLRRSDGKWSPA